MEHRIMAFSIESVESQTTQISNIFIDEYMPKAHPPYVLVYLYAYCHISNGDTSLTNRSIAEALDLLESDVIKSWKYWQKQGLIKLSEDGNIHFLTVQSKKNPIKQQEQQSMYHKTDSTSPQYTPEEILTISKNSPTAKKLFSLAEYYLGRTLQYEDMTTILGFNEWLQLSLEVIKLLFSYCTETKHYHLNYIEKVAISWANDGITTPERASEYIKLHQSGYKQIMRALGQSGRMITPVEEEYVRVWTSEYHFSIEMILIACEKAILQTGGSGKTFKYVHSILKNWYEKKIHTPEEVEIADKNFQASKENKKVEPKTEQKKIYKNTTVKQNRFVNYEQRQWDFEELERLARERLKKS